MNYFYSETQTSQFIQKGLIQLSLMSLLVSNKNPDPNKLVLCKGSDLVYTNTDIFAKQTFMGYNIYRGLCSL